MKKVSNKLLDIYSRKIKKWVLSKELIEDKDVFYQNFCDICLKEVKSIKDCSEKAIVTTYLEVADKLINKGLLINGVGYGELLTKSRTSLSIQYTSKLSKNSDIVEIYFNDVKKEYIKHPMNESDDLLFLPENRDIFLKNNLKLVIDVAKRYSFNNMGVTFEDLIQIGNYGLCVAFDRYDEERANLRIAIIKDIKQLPDKEVSREVAEEIIRKNYVYSKNLDSTLSLLPQQGFTDRDAFISWTKKNVKAAVFASVAFQWIRAYIMNEISKYGKIIKFPKPTTEEEEEKINTNIIYLDSINNYTLDCYHDNLISEIANENFMIEDDSINNIDHENVYSGIIDNLLNVLNATEKRILKKRYGIGYPYQLTPIEIAENEGLSANKVKYIITVAMKKINESLTPEKRKYIQDMMVDY